VWDGFWSEDVMPSPNDQTHEVGVFVDESTNWTASGHGPSVSVAVKEATGEDEDELTET